jgi:hypothetical protein
MAALIKYSWDTGTSLYYDPKEKTVYTYFLDGTRTGGAVVPEDTEHADLLGITPLQHRLLHELAHSMIAKALGYRECPILMASAHNEPMPDHANELEWFFTVISYLAYYARQRDPGGYETITKLIRKGLDPVHLALRLRWCVDATLWNDNKLTIFL